MWQGSRPPPREALSNLLPLTPYLIRRRGRWTAHVPATYEDTPTWEMGAVLLPFWILPPPQPVCFALPYYVPALTDEL